MALVAEGRQVLDIPVGEIRPNPRQPRAHFAPEELQDLVASIREHGILLPLVVTRAAEGYELVAGERRLRASKLAGLATVPAIVRDATEQQKLELALIENVQRQDLNALEEAVAYEALVEEFGLTQEQVAERVGKSRSAVANTLRLLDLSEPMREALREGNITKSHARTLLAESDPAKRMALFEAMLAGGVTVRQAEKTVAVHAHRRIVSGSPTDPNMLAHTKRLEEILGTKVEIRERAGKGTITLHFYAKDDLADLLHRLAELG